MIPSAELDWNPFTKGYEFKNPGLPILVYLKSVVPNLSGSLDW